MSNKGSISGNFNTNRTICTRCKSKVSFYTDELNEHDLWLCWKCGKFNGITHVCDEFNDMIKVNPPLIFELITEGVLIPVEPKA